MIVFTHAQITTRRHNKNKRRHKTGKVNFVNTSRFICIRQMLEDDINVFDIFRIRRMFSSFKRERFSLLSIYIGNKSNETQSLFLELINAHTANKNYKLFHQRIIIRVGGKNSEH